MTSLPARFLLSASAACLLGLAAAPEPAPAQTYVPGASLHPLILSDVTLDYAQWLLLPPRGAGLAAAARGPEAVRMNAYRQFERALLARTGGIAGGSDSSEERKARKRRVLAGLGDKLENVPGASLVRQGERLWRRIEDSTDFRFEGYRVRLRVDEVVDGKLALKVQKKLH